jgi:branched-chain amino acid transport system substrate-binding protein
MSQAYPDITHENFLNVLVSSQYFTLSGLLLGPYSKSCNQGMRSVSLLKIDTNGTLINMPETKYSWDTCLSSNGDVVPPIVFGQSAPLLGSVMDLGIGMRQGILSSFLARNKQGGVRNRKLVLLSRNDGYEPEPAAENANYFIQERDVFGLVGSVGTAPSEAILPTINEYSVPFIGALSGASSLRSPCNHNIVNVRASYIDEVAAMTQHFIDNLGLRRLSIFYQNDGFGSAGLEGLQLALSNRSMEIESRGTYERNTLDLAEGFSSIQQGDPEAIVLIGTYEQLAKFIQMALEWKSDLVFGTVSFVDSEALASSLRAVQVSTDNIYVTQVVPDPNDNGNQLVALYQNSMLARDASSTFGFVSLEGYVVAEFLIKVLDSIDSTLDITRETFLDTVFSQTIFLVGGQAIGPFSGSAGNCTCNQGLHRIVTTRISSSSNYSLAEVPENAFKFDTCGVQYPENFVPVSDGVRGGIIAAACACVGAAITFIVLSVYHRESKTIKHSSLTFSLMTLVGAAFMMFSPVLIVLVVPQCMVWLWFVCIGFILFFGSMAVKSYRIDRIFNWHRKKLTKIKPIGDSQLMVVVSVLLGLEVILLILWQFFGELRPLEFEGTNDAIFGCYSDNAFPFIITQICYFGVVFLVGCFFAFRTRNVNFGSYKETKEIFFAVYNMTLLFIIIIPLVALIGVNDTSTAAIITSIGLLFSTLVSILCLYVLKFYRIINKREKLSTSSQTGTGSNVGGSTGRSKVSNIVGSGSARAESINEQYKSSDTTKDIDRLSSKN